MTEVMPGSEAFKSGVRNNDRLLEVNGANIEKLTHEQVVDMIRHINGSLMFLLTDQETEKYYKNKRVKLGGWLATTEYLPHKPRIISMTKGSDGYGFMLKEVPKLTGKAIMQIFISQISGNFNEDETPEGSLSLISVFHNYRPLHQGHRERQPSRESRYKGNGQAGGC